MTHQATLMAHAATRASESKVLRSHHNLSFRLGPYAYQIDSDQVCVSYTVSDGKRSVSEPLLFAFGSGAVGQTFVFKRNGSYYETRVSFYTSIGDLDITPGHRRSVPANLEDALGDRLGPALARRCFSCHNTAAVTDTQLRVDQMVPGVTCEACHGPGARHVAAMKARRFQRTLIFNPAVLNAEQLVDFCGSCHRTSLDVIETRLRGMSTVRFQPYRLEKSRCSIESDSRLSCLACHDPHQQVSHDASFYDAKCLACHASKPAVKLAGERSRTACLVSNRNCISCHMPKVEPPGLHSEFTDHWIRVVRPGEPYPE